MEYFNTMNLINNNYVQEECDNDDFILHRESKVMFDEPQLDIVDKNSIKTEEKISGVIDNKINIRNLLKHYIEMEYFYCCNNQLYIYNSQFGYLKKIGQEDEALKIKELLEYEIRCSISSKQIEELVKRLKSEPSININLDELNSNSNYINCKNGIVDIVDAKLLPHDVTYKFTYCINANYLGLKDEKEKEQYGEETAKFFDSSLESDESKRKLLLEIIGYLMSDFNNAKKAFIFLGKPHSGKSLLTKIISNLLGAENISNIPFHKLGERFSNSELSTHKLNINAELDSAPVRKISNFKAIVGGDIICGEFKGKPLFSFKSKTKLLFCGNMMPDIKDVETTEAFTDRLVFLIFNRTTPKEEIDYQLEEKLMNEADALFTRSMHALKSLINNNFEFTIPKDSMEFLEAYKNNQNHISEFIAECCELSTDNRVHTKAIYQVYLKFCEDNCINPYQECVFSQYLLNLGYIERTRFRLNGNNLRGFRGISIKKFSWDGTEH